MAYHNGYRVTNNGEVVNQNKNKIIKTSIWKKGNNNLYKRFSYKGYKVLVYHLAAYQKFQNEWLFGELLVRHLNDNFLDDSLNNIVLGTKRDNTMDIPIEKRKRNLSKAHEAARLFTKEQVLDIRKNKFNKSYTELAKEYNCYKLTIKNIIKRKTYKHIAEENSN